MNERAPTKAVVPQGRRWDDRVTTLALGRLEMEDSAAVFGLVACLVLFSLALGADIVYDVVVIYAFPIALAAWFFGRWVGGAMGAFALVAHVAVALATNQRLDALAVVVPAIVFVTLLSIAGTEWARRSGAWSVSSTSASYATVKCSTP